MFRKMLFIVLALIGFFGQTVWAGVAIEGNESLFKQEYWLPQKAYIGFFHDSEGKLSGYRLIFQANKGELFSIWKMKNSSGATQTFPFVLESTLIIENANEVEKTGRWGFGRLDGDNSDTPEAYIDSTFSDFGEDNFGIGIMNPHELIEAKLYDYWYELEGSSWLADNPQTLSAILRFRLNIDLSAAKKFGYSEDEIERDFKLGDGWAGYSYIDKYGYYWVDTSMYYSAQHIGSYFSFAIEEYRPTNKKDAFSYYFNLNGMEGQWCKVGNEDPYPVNSPEECFSSNSLTQRELANMASFNNIQGYLDPIQPIDPPSPPPTPIILPNLRLDEMKVYRGDTLLKSGANQSQVGEKLATENYIVSEKANCTNGTTAKDIKSTVEVQIGDGEWKVFDTVYTQPSTLTKDKPHKETSHYTIPEEARGKMLRFRIRIDVDNVVKESNESDNLSDPDNERYPVVGDYNLIVPNAGLTNGLSTVYQNTIGRVRYAIENVGKDTPLSSQGIRSTAEVMRPGETNFSLIAEDGSDSDELSPGRLQEESTALDGFSFNLPGLWTFRVTADCYNKLIETNEIDNVYLFTVNVVPDNRKAVVVVTEARLKEGSSFKKNTRIHPICKVKNYGDAFPAGPITLDYLIDGKRRDGDTIQASELGPGVEKEEKVNNDDIRLGDKGNRKLTVVAKINGVEVSRKDYSFKVK